MCRGSCTQILLKITDIVNFFPHKNLCMNLNVSISTSLSLLLLFMAYRSKNTHTPTYKHLFFSAETFTLTGFYLYPQYSKQEKINCTKWHPIQTFSDKHLKMYGTWIRKVPLPIHTLQVQRICFEVNIRGVKMGHANIFFGEEITAFLLCFC